MPRHQVQVVTCPISETITEPIYITGVGMAALMIPLVTSCQLFLRGSFDTTSANFSRISKTDGSSDFAWNAGPGPKGISLSDISFPYVKLEFGVAQSAVRSVTVLTKP